MSNRRLILVALSVIVVLAGATVMQARRPPGGPSPVLNAMVRAEPPRPLEARASVDADGVSMAFNRRIKRPTLINFWATWCEPCLRELPSVGQFKTMADAAGIDVLTVSEDVGGAGPPVKLLTARGLGFLPLVIDADGALAASLGIRGVPTTLIVNAKGEEVARLEGELDWGQESALDAVIGLLDLPRPKG